MILLIETHDAFQRAQQQIIYVANDDAACL